MTKRNATVVAVINTLRAAGIEPEPPEATGHSHWRVRWSVNGHNRSYFLGNSPSDHRAARNASADVRRMLRQDGLRCGKFRLDKDEPNITRVSNSQCEPYTK